MAIGQAHINAISTGEDASIATEDLANEVRDLKAVERFFDRLATENHRLGKVTLSAS